MPNVERLKMANRELPKVGDTINVEQLHVSKMNVHYGEPFGESVEDQQLIANLRHGKIVHAFKARPEEGSYGVVVGRRRFLAKKMLNTQKFLVGEDCHIEDMTDQEARKASLIENLHRQNMNCMVRAEALNEVVSFSGQSLRENARTLGFPVSNLSEWLSILKLSQKMREALRTGVLGYTDGMKLVRLDFGEALQDELAEVLEREGPEVFWREVARREAGRKKRGMPRGMFYAVRVLWDKRSRDDMRFREVVAKAAAKRGMKENEYVKDFLKRNIGLVERDLA